MIMETFMMVFLEKMKWKVKESTTPTAQIYIFMDILKEMSA